MRKYYHLTENSESVDLYIYGDISSWPWEELGDVSAYSIVQEIETVELNKINVYINSYGGEVAEGLAIYNALKRHKAHVTTYCDGFACSAASIVFMAGDTRIMGEASLLMIHNAWTYAAGNAQQLHKEAENLEKISETAAAAYRSAVNISEDELQVLLDAESWITPAEALEMSFATQIVSVKQSAYASMNVRKSVYSMIHTSAAKNKPDEAEPTEIPPEPQETKQNIFFNFGGTK